MKHITIILLLSLSYCFNYVPQIEIDLSEPPRQRWKEAVRTVLDLHGFENSFGPIFEFHNQNTFYILEPQDYVTIASSLRRNYPEYSLELEGIVEEMNQPEVTFEYLAAWAYYHEIAHITSDVAECTGVLFCVGDQIIHGRNMDQGPGQGRNVVLHMTIKKDGKYIGEAVDWYWFKAGFITLLKYDVVSLEENWRYDDQLSKEQVMSYIQSGGESIPWIFRDVLVNNELNTFDKVVSYLETNQVGCALYQIVGGISQNQGVIITRDPFQTYPTLSLNNTGEGLGYKYIVQTNYDHWLPDPEDDPRRTTAENLLSQLQSNLWNEFGIYAIMDTYPVHNEGTFITVIMNAKYNRIIVFGQNSITLTDE